MRRSFLSTVVVVVGLFGQRHKIWRIGPIERTGLQTVELKNPPSKVDDVYCMYWDLGDLNDPDDDTVKEDHNIWFEYSKPRLSFTPGEIHRGNFCAAVEK